MRLDYVDIFYSHRFDPDTPLEETMGALDAAVRQGKARYVGISSYGPRRTEEAALILRELGTPLLIHQPSYSMLNRWIEDELLDVLDREGVGCIVFSPLAQGLLTDSTSTACPRTRACASATTSPRSMLTDENLARVRALNEIAQRRGQSLAQMAIAWVLRDPRVTSALLGASSVGQLEQNVAALERLDFDAGELEEIDRHAVDGGINIWEQSSRRSVGARSSAARLGGLARRPPRGRAKSRTPRAGGPRCAESSSLSGRDSAHLGLANEPSYVLHAIPPCRRRDRAARSWQPGRRPARYFCVLILPGC